MKKSKTACGWVSWVAAAVGICVSIQPARGKDPVLTSEAPTTMITHVDAKAAGEMVAKKSVLVLDLRTPKEFAGGHIPGATNIDYYAHDFAQQLAKLDKAKKYLVYCAIGGRSTQSLKVFKQLQFASIVHLDGGIKTWKKADNPLEK